MAAFVLVHGAFQGGWVWRPVSSLLRGAGHAVFTPTLTGAGERTHLIERDIDLSVYIRDVVNTIHFEDLNDVILVGHSYAGMIITAVADEMPDRVSNLVYLDAVVPEAGKSFVDIAGSGFGQLLARHTIGWKVRPWPLQAFGISREEDRQWFSSHLVHFPSAAFASTFPGTGSHSRVDRTYIRCTENQSEFLQRTADQCRHERWNYYELPTGHSPMITLPAELAGLLVHIASPDRAGRG